MLNLVAINALHNIIHLALGISGLMFAKTLPGSQRWGAICGPILLVLFIAGMIQAYLEGLPHDQLFLGLVPLNSPGHILHLVTGGIALYLSLVSVRKSDPGTTSV